MHRGWAESPQAKAQAVVLAVRLGIRHPQVAAKAARWSATTIASGSRHREAPGTWHTHHGVAARTIWWPPEATGCSIASRLSSAARAVAWTEAPGRSTAATIELADAGNRHCWHVGMRLGRWPKAGQCPELGRRPELQLGPLMDAQRLVVVVHAHAQSVDLPIPLVQGDTVQQLSDAAHAAQAGVYGRQLLRPDQQDGVTCRRDQTRAVQKPFPWPELLTIPQTSGRQRIKTLPMRASGRYESVSR